MCDLNFGTEKMLFMLCNFLAFSVIAGRVVFSLYWPGLPLSNYETSLIIMYAHQYFNLIDPVCQY